MKNNEIAKSILSAIGIIALVCLLFAAASCTIAKHPTAGLYASLGGDMDKFKADEVGFSFDKNENSPAFNAALKQIRVMWQSYLMLQGLEFLGGKYYDKAGQEISSAQTVKLQELQNAKDIKTAELRLEELKLFQP